MLHAHRLVGLVCPILLVAGCRDVTDPAAPSPGRLVADVTTAVSSPVLFYSTYLGGSAQDERGSASRWTTLATPT
jgi:hypothetical protein